MHQVNDFRGPILVRNADGPPARHPPQNILVADLESPLIGQINCKRLERSLLSRFSDLLRCHIQISTELNSKVVSPDLCRTVFMQLQLHISAGNFTLLFS